MIKFYLATPQRERSAIILSVTFKGKQYRRTTKESTLVKFWNPQRQRVRVCRENRLANCTNDALELWCQAAQRAEVYFKKGYTIPSSRDFFVDKYPGASPLTITLIILSVILPAMPMRGR